ncbi:MAG: hypothetical protein K2Q24_12760 [Chitinophagaceae bacterium]|jgi:hypothetical protein|nr:hypothetical protein [Chitinophagaceae bacterium]
MRKLIVLLFLLFAFNSYAQQKRMNQCGFIIPDNVMIPPNRFASVYEARDILQNMLDTLVWRENFMIREENGINNAYATILNGRRWIIYDNTFLEKLDYITATKWASISVLAHELGHHYKNHVVDAVGSTPSKELEADFVSGFIMAKFGASVNEAKAAMSKIASDYGSSSHPPKNERLNAIGQGWNYAKGLSNAPTPPSNPTGPGNTKPQSGQGTAKPQTQQNPPSAPPVNNPTTDMSWIHLTVSADQPITVFLSDDGRKFEPVELKPGEPFVFKFEIYQYGWMKLVNSPTAKSYRLSHFKDYSIVWSRRNRNWLVIEIP